MDPYPALEMRHDSGAHSVVDSDGRVLLTPMPQAGSTPLLHLLARSTGLDVTDSDDAAMTAVSPQLRVTEPSFWPPEARWADADEEQRTAIAESHDWIRLTTTRDPGSRVWAAWQATVLVGAPDAVERFGDQPWFPREVEAVAELVARFREFVQALPTDDLVFRDREWAPQTLLVEGLPEFTHVVPLARLDEAVTLLADRLGVRRDGLPAAESALIPYTPAVYDAATAAIVNRIYGPDFEVFDHRPVEEVDAPLSPEWQEQVGALLPAVHALAGRHARYAELHRRWTEATAAVARERSRVEQLRSRADEQWDGTHDDRAALTALTRRAETAEAQAAAAEGELAELRTDVEQRPAARTRERARSLARRLRTRGSGEAGTRG